MFGLNRGRPLPIAMAVAAATAAGVVGAGAPLAAASPHGAVAHAAAKAPIVVGTSLPLTGGEGPLGVQLEQGYKTWAADVNQRGGLLGHKVKLAVLDDQTNENQVVSDFNTLISKDNAAFVFGTFSAQLALPAMSVARRHNMLYLNPAGGDSQVFDQNYPLQFYTEPTTPPNFGVAFARYVTKLPKKQRPKTVGYIVNPQDPFTSTLVDGMRTIIKRAGIKTVMSVTYPSDTTNFSPIASQVASSHPQLLVDVGSAFGEGVSMMRALVQANAKPRIFYQNTAPTLVSQYVKAVGKRNAQGVFYPNGYTPQLKTHGNAGFNRVFRKAYHKAPNEYPAFGYAAGQILEAALHAVGPKGIKNQSLLGKWLHKHTVQTVVGPIRWNKKGMSLGTFPISQIQNGKSKVVLPPHLAVTKKIVPCWRCKG